MSTSHETHTQIVGVAAKHTHPLARKLTQRVIDFLSSRAVPFLIDTNTAAAFELTTTERVIQKCAREELTTKCNIIVVLGGDGTLISVSRHPSAKSPTIIGVNLGTLGFLTEIASDELIPTLEKVLAGQHPTARKFLLKATVVRGGKQLVEFAAINDVVITKEALARIFAVEISVDSTFAALLKGDGVIVASPSGSTAYSLAAGGSIVHPNVDALLLTPICPHSLTSRPLVLPGKTNLGLKVFNTNKDETIYLTIDGQTGMPLQNGDQVQITTSTYSICFAKSPTKDYFEVLGTKLKWAAK